MAIPTPGNVTAVNNIGTTTDIAIPSGTANDDVVDVMTAYDAEASSITWDAELIEDFQENDAASNLTVGLAHRIIDGTETGPWQQSAGGTVEWGQLAFHVREQCVGNLTKQLRDK